MAKVFGFHQIELRPGVTPEQFEQFVRDEVASAAVQPVWTIHVLKGDRGMQDGKFAVLIEIESVETRDRLFPEPGGQPSREGQQHLASANTLMEKWASLATAPGEPGTVWTGVCQIECVNGTLSVLLGWQAPREAYRELVADARPILWRHRPFPRDLTRDQEQELARRLPARERAFRLGHLAQLPVVPLDRIGRVDQPSDLRSILEHRRQVFPMRFPSPQRNRIAAAPLL